MRRILFGLLIIACAGLAHATERQYFFQRVSADDVLAQNTVNAIFQDREGFVWIATQGGLHRYDGYQFVLFQHNPEDPDSLPSSFVTAIAEDAQGKLWIGTNGSGVASYDAAARKFVPEGAEQQAPNRRGAVSALLFDPEHGLWIGSRLGVELLTPDHRRRDVLVLPGEGAQTVFKLAHAADGSIWVATSEGVYRITPQTLQTERVGGTLPGPVQSIRVDRAGRVWAGAADGLYALAPNQPSRRVWPEADNPEDAGRAQVVDIEEDDSGRLWLAAFPNGVAVYDPGSGKAERLRHDPRLRGSLPEDSIRVLSRDRSGLLWLGGVVHGVASVDPLGAKFVYLLDDDAAHSFVDTNNVRALHEDAQGGLWIGTEGDGLKRYDAKTHRFDYFNDVLGLALGQRKPLRELRVFVIRDAGDNKLWIASNMGVFLLDPAARRATTLPVDPAREDALSDPVVRSLLVGRDGSLWMGGFASGLTRYEPASKRWTHYRAHADDSGSLWHNMIHALFEDRAGRLWIGTFDGVNVLETKSGVLRRIAQSSTEKTSLAGNLTRSIFEARDGTLWIGSHNGLSRLEEYGADAVRFKRYLASDGLPNSTIYAILEDARGNLWLSTNRGIVAFDRNAERFRSFSLEEGLQGLEFNGGSALKLADGRLAFGGSEGVNLFAPERIGVSTFEPKLAFTAFSVGGKRASVAEPERFNTLTIAQRDRIVAFEFASLDFGAPARNRFEYRLEGFDSRWLALGARRDLTFTNLDPGSYTLHVRGTNRDLAWSPRQLQLGLVVTPPWWLTQPMKAAYLAAALALFFLPIVSHRRRLRREQLHTRELREREERLKVAIWGSGDEFWDWDIGRGMLYRVGADNLLGFASEHQLSGDDWRRHSVHPDDLARVEGILAEHVAGKREFFESEHRVRNSHGEWVWVRSRGKIVDRDPSGQPMRIAGTARDITSSREIERDRRIAQEVIRSMSEAVTVTDLDFVFVSINPAFTRITGYTEAEIEGQPSSMLNCAQHSEDFHRTLRHTVVSTGHWSGEIWQRRKNGDEFLCWLELSEVCDRAGARTHWVGVLSDITDRKRAEQELRYLANFDTLTGLPNRTLLGERLAHALVRARRHAARVAVLFLDLDRFKHVNDSLGHAAGDRLLNAAAARIQAVVRETDTVARLGGDEFTVVLEDLHDQAEAERVAEKLLEAFRGPLDIDGRAEVVISTSIGIALYPDHAQLPTDLLKFADTAMYHAKDKGRNAFQTYTETMDAQARLRASMVAHLHKALERNEFYLVFQPKMSLADGRITGAEVLLRWRNPELGLVPPMTFIPLAEETGLIVPIGEWVLREACHQIHRWTKSGITTPSVAVNISMLQLTRGELTTRLAAILEECKVPAQRLEVELTESMVMANAEQSIKTLTEIKALGVKVAIDDFGTGYSSLAYLKRLPIDTIKIDKEFVGDITNDPDDEAITATVIMMAHSLDLEVVAEGVETPEQLEYLREQKCDEVQGNLISAPLEADRALKFLLDRKAQYEKRSGVREFPGPARKA